ncbi:MAG: DUF5060 domain-containing protein [Prosthecobacter sp.]|uniref:DUF5060 domain-containing protein n=1 Tax=Prosthecobacter sp. TaxID=1965333 RepID=UPI0038FD66FF
MKTNLTLLFALLATAALGKDDIPVAAAPSDITIEAESFVKQTHDEKRKWEIKRERSDASGGSYIEALPDTRVTHDDKLIKGENFTDEAGAMAVVEYDIEVKESGRYFVWARVWSSDSEDNGLHFGLDGQWPDSGKRWQTTKKSGWHWDCKQRTAEVHTGVPMQLWLDIAKPGKHTLMMSMREDGAEVDQISLRKSLPAENNSAPVAQTQFKAVPRQPDGNATIAVTGELKQWHKVTLTLDGPFAAETDDKLNAFTDLAFNVTFTHESGSPKYTVPGYFAADGNAGETSAESGTKWRAHLSPDKAGTWNYSISFTKGQNTAIEGGGEALKPFDGIKGWFQISATDKTGRDFRSQGRLQYVGKHHLQFAGSKQYFLKAGPDSPETLLAFTDFDNTSANKADKVPLKTWAPHSGDWKSGDPTWKKGKGKNLIGALNYLAGKGVNAFSFLTYNVAGDGDNVWPFIERNAKLNYDCSKLDQWGIVFDHATKLGLYLHFKLQENESDDERLGMGRKDGKLPEALDGGKLGPERKLYCRELIARFGHALALNWNIGEENTQSTEEVRDMVKYLHDTDPYQHHIVLHTFPPEQEKVYRPLLGDKSLLTGLSLQNSWKAAHQRTLQWRHESAAAGRPWVVANDEQNSASLGVPPDPGYKGHSGIAEEKDAKGPKGEGYVSSKAYTMHDVRKLTLWGSLMAGGAGVEYYFGYKLPENDLICQDFRSRDQSWDYCRIAFDFFRDAKIPFAEMSSANALIGNTKDNNDKYCFAKAGELYLVYLPNGGTTGLDLSAAKDTFTLHWFNPREGGALKDTETKLQGGKNTTLTAPDANDWLAVIRKQ